MYVAILLYTDFTVYHGDPRGSLKGRDLTENSFVANHVNVRCPRLGPVDHLQPHLVLGLVNVLMISLIGAL